jgi:hypothetical protein
MLTRFDCIGVASTLVICPCASKTDRGLGLVRGEASPLAVNTDIIEHDMYGFLPWRGLSAFWRLVRSCQGRQQREIGVAGQETTKRTNAYQEITRILRGEPTRVRVR